MSKRGLELEASGAQTLYELIYQENLRVATMCSQKSTGGTIGGIGGSATLLGLEHENSKRAIYGIMMLKATLGSDDGYKWQQQVTVLTISKVHCPETVACEVVRLHTTRSRRGESSLAEEKLAVFSDQNTCTLLFMKQL